MLATSLQKIANEKGGFFHVAHFNVRSVRNQSRQTNSNSKAWSAPASSSFIPLPMSRYPALKQLAWHRKYFPESFRISSSSREQNAASQSRILPVEQNCFWWPMLKSPVGPFDHHERSVNVGVGMKQKMARCGPTPNLKDFVSHCRFDNRHLQIGFSRPFGAVVWGLGLRFVRTRVLIEAIRGCTGSTRDIELWKVERSV